jgi:hypothetical protein
MAAPKKKTPSKGANGNVGSRWAVIRGQVSQTNINPPGYRGAIPSGLTAGQIAYQKRRPTVTGGGTSSTKRAM